MDGWANAPVLLVSRAEAYTSYNNTHHVRQKLSSTTTFIAYDNVAIMVDTLTVGTSRRSYTLYGNLLSILCTPTDGTSSYLVYYDRYLFSHCTTMIQNIDTL